MIDRKTFIVQLAAGLLAAPLIRAQQSGKLVRIGVVRGVDEPIPPPVPPAGGWPLERGLRNLGWVEGRNFVFETRWAGPNPQRMREMAAELKALPVALIVASSTTVIKAVREGAPGVPVVMVMAGDALVFGFAASLAHPGGDMTGTAVPGVELYGKQLELLAEMVPRVKRIVVLGDPSHPARELFYQAMLLRAKSLGVELDRADVSAPEQLEPAIARSTGRALLVAAAPMFLAHRARIVESTLRFRIPSMYTGRYNVHAGGLMSYDARDSWYWHKTAYYIDKILSGAKPGDLPIEQPTEFELVINAKTAKALGLTIPQSLLLRADEVIE